MKIEPIKITIRDLCEGYEDNEEAGVVGYGGKLDIRPAYQREFIYGEKQQEAVITTVKQNFPLNTMYWAKKEDGTFEIIDGQQRTLSICKFVNGDFAHDFRYFHNMQKDEKEQILNYELQIYVCEGSPSEKLKWFRVINIAGETLTEQELLNATYAGSWLADAKKKFSKSNCPAFQMGKDYVSGSPIRQAYLETALKWINNGKVEDYMARHQNDPNANALWLYFRNVIEWVQNTFVVKRVEMKHVDWGSLYNKYHEQVFDTKQLEDKVKQLMMDSDVTNKKGIYTYVLTGEQKYLNIRDFDDNMRRSAYERQNGICPKCGKHFELNEMHADHITPWAKGGPTTKENCQMLCAQCNRIKSSI